MLIPKIAQFFLLPVYTRFLSPAEYGIISNVLVINAIIALTYTLALDRAIFRLYFDFKKENEKRDYLGTIFIGISISAVIITALAFALSDLIGSIYKSIEFYPYMSLSILSSAVASFHIVPKTTYFVKEKANIFVSLSVAEFLSRNIFIFSFVVLLEKGVLGYLQGQLIGNLILLPLFLFLAKKQTNFRFVKSYFKKSLKFSLPLLPMALSVWIINFSDRIFIERYFSTNDVGIYSLGYNISMLIVIFSDSFYKAYNPYYFKTAANNIREKALSILKKTNTIYLLIVILFCASIALFAKEGIIILFDERYREAYKIVAIISLSYVFAKGAGIIQLAIYQDKKTSFLLIVSLIGAAVNIGLNFLLVEKHGAFGAAWATVFTFVIMFIIKLMYSKYVFYASFNKLIVIPLFIILVIVNVIFYYIEINVVYSIIIKLLTLGLLIMFFWSKYKSELKTILAKK
jgi:O-antigen/teichoic acid export membrane protein